MNIYYLNYELIFFYFIGCNVNILCDEEQNFKALQFTNESMRNAMNAWPEFVAVDGTYKLIDIGCTVFLCLVEDSNGQAEIVSVSLLSVEDSDTYTWVFDMFKKEMSTDNIKCFMGDKDLVERDVIKKLFPGTPMYLCLFHTLKTFRREISCEKLHISKQERDLSLEYLQKLVYSEDESQYNSLYTQFKECVPQSVSQYFDKNWHHLRHEWLVSNMISSNLNNRTNNRMESMNHKIKQVVPRNSTLIQFIKNFFIFMDTHNQERDAKAANHILKKPLVQFLDHQEDLLQYMNLLTNYSFDYVHKQINSIEKVKIMNKSDNGFFEVSCSNRNTLTTAESCQCGDFSSMLLPCRHIFAVRKHQHIPLFSKDLCHIRWTRSYYLTKQRVGVVNSNITANISCTVSRKQKILTLTEKRKAAIAITNSLVELLSLSSNSEFNHKLEILKKLEFCWKSGQQISINTIDDEQANTNDNDIDKIDPAKTTSISCIEAAKDSSATSNTISSFTEQIDSEQSHTQNH